MDRYIVVIADFGLAQLLPTDSARVTKGFVAPTSSRAPEVFESQYSWQVDVFSLAGHCDMGGIEW